jgi:hypothetical protein
MSSTARTSGARLLALATAAATTLIMAAAQGAPLALGSTSTASGPTPYAPGCGGPGEAAPGSVNYANAEVEAHLAVNPANPNNVVTAWQQDRWDDGGSHGTVVGYSQNGGATWRRSTIAFSDCAGGSGTAGGFERATDPWLSFSPNGRLHAISIGFDNSTARNAILAAYSDDGGASWTTPRVLRYDNPRAVGNNFNDKETLTANPLNPHYVYATWQRIVSPSERTSAAGFENAASFASSAWFARSTNGGQTWEPAREVYADRGSFTQTIGNQVQVLPDGSLVMGFNLIRAVSNRQGTRGYSVAVIRSTDNGETWTRQTMVNRLLVSEVTDPETGADVRTGDIIPDFAVDLSNTATRGTVYAVWMDARFNGGAANDILLARSTDGGRSWSAPVVVDRAPADVDAFTAMVDVDGQGRVAVTYYDFRRDTVGDGTLSTDFWITHSHDRGMTFTDEQRLTESSFDMRSAPFAQGYFVGDYTGLDHNATTFWAAWVGANDANTTNPTDVFVRSGQ